MIERRRLHPNKNLILYTVTGDASPFCKGNYKVTVTVSDAEESKLHRGEVGTLWFTVHSTSDGTGARSNKIQLNDKGYHEPGTTNSYVVPGDVMEKIKSVEVEFQYDTNVMNPLTWRMFSAPRLYVSKIELENLEMNNR